MAHKYLEDIGVNPPNTLRKDNFTFRKEREVYGFDARDCWDLSFTFYCWLYEHLKKYLKDASEFIDLEFHKFTYNGEEFTQLALIEELLKRLEFYFSDEYNDFDEIEFNYVKGIGEIWALILPAMWW